VSPLEVEEMLEVKAAAQAEKHEGVEIGRRSSQLISRGQGRAFHGGSAGVQEASLLERAPSPQGLFL
jgi:hypothetical protein